MRKIVIALAIATASMAALAANAQTRIDRGNVVNSRQAQTAGQPRNLQPNDPSSPDSSLSKVRGALSQGFAPVDTETNRSRGSFR